MKTMNTQTGCPGKLARSVAIPTRLMIALSALLVCAIATTAMAAPRTSASRRGKTAVSRSQASRQGKQTIDGILETPQGQSPSTRFQSKGADAGPAGGGSGTAQRKICFTVPVYKCWRGQPEMGADGRISRDEICVLVFEERCVDVK